MKELKKILVKKKFLTVDQFINFALYDKKYGYYIKNFPFGKSGDFVTAPIISNIFCEMIAIWCLSYWENLNKPKKFNLVELGPGSGDLCFSLLKTFQKFPDFYKALEVNLIEISKTLEKKQKAKINFDKVRWIKNIAELKHGPVLFLANEFFDSLPIKQIVKKNKKILERVVSLDKNKNFRFSLISANNKIKNAVKKIDNFKNLNFIEYPEKTIEYLINIKKKIVELNGGILIIDYGYVSKKINKDTLQSVKNHKYCDIFKYVTKSDITSHVNFTLIDNFLKKKKLHTCKVTNQGEFLQKLGIKERADILSKNLTFKKKIKLFSIVKRLLDDREMGKIFKVFFAQKRDTGFNLGFR